MRHTLIMILALTISPTFSIAQKRVANYSTGSPGTESYEQLSFWTKNGLPDKIVYTYGDSRKQIPLNFKPVSGNSFKLIFPNQTILLVSSQGDFLHVTGDEGKYSKVFNWEYEGPVDGRGTFCNQCAADEREAAKIMQEAYFRHPG